jgi:hypothetical protein
MAEIILSSSHSKLNLMYKQNGEEYHKRIQSQILSVTSIYNNCELKWPVLLTLYVFM